MKGQFILKKLPVNDIKLNPVKYLLFPLFLIVNFGTE